MAFMYLEFHGKKHEDVENFLEQMEIACIINHVLDCVKILCLIWVCLNRNAQALFKDYEEELQRLEPPLPLSLDNLKQDSKEDFVK